MVVLIIHPSLIVLHIFSYRIVMVKFNAGSNHACAFPTVKAEYISSYQSPPSGLSKVPLLANRQLFNEPPKQCAFFFFVIVRQIVVQRVKPSFVR